MIASSTETAEVVGSEAEIAPALQKIVSVDETHTVAIATIQGVDEAVAEMVVGIASLDADVALQGPSRLHRDPALVVRAELLLVTALVDTPEIIDEQGAAGIVVETAEEIAMPVSVGLVRQVLTVTRPRARDGDTPRHQAVLPGAADVTLPCQLPRDPIRGLEAVAKDGTHHLMMIAAAHQARDAIGDVVVRRFIVEASSEAVTDPSEVVMNKRVKQGEEIALQRPHVHQFEANLLMFQKIHRDPPPPPSRPSPRRTTKRLVHPEWEGHLRDGSAM